MDDQNPAYLNHLGIELEFRFFESISSLSHCSGRAPFSKPLGSVQGALPKDAMRHERLRILNSSSSLQAWNIDLIAVCQIVNETYLQDCSTPSQLPQ